MDQPTELEPADGTEPANSDEGEPFDILIATLSDTNSRIREAVVRSLGNLGDLRAIAHLEELLLTEEDKWVQEDIEEALEKLRQ